MDILYIIGLFLGIVVIITGNIMEHGSVKDVMGGPAAYIVFGGTFAAILVHATPATLKSMGVWFLRLLKPTKVDAPALIEEIVDLATRARREGILGLEKLAPNVSDPFLARALMMAIDGADSNTIRDTMEITMSCEEDEGNDAAKVWEAAGGYAPTVGIIGAVLGLMQVMKNLQDIEAVGRGIAVAFIATIYGVGGANLLFIPIGGRIKLRVKEESMIREMMLQGVLSIQEGTNPKLVRDRLNSFLKDSEKPKAEEAGA